MRAAIVLQTQTGRLSFHARAAGGTRALVRAGGKQFPRASWTRYNCKLHDSAVSRSPAERWLEYRRAWRFRNCNCVARTASDTIPTDPAFLLHAELGEIKGVRESTRCRSFVSEKPENRERERRLRRELRMYSQS